MTNHTTVIEHPVRRLLIALPDAFGTAGGKALTEGLSKLGITPVLDQGYANQSQDFTPVVLAIKQSGADVLGSYFTFENDLGIFARQLRGKRRINK